MKTKEVLKSKVNKYSKGQDIRITSPGHLTYNIKFPYGKKHSHNLLYWFLCQFLVPNKNCVGLLYEDNTYGDLDIPTLIMLYGRCEKSFRAMLSILQMDGIVILIKTGGLNRLFINPYFCVAGDSFPEFLLELVEKGDGVVAGEHLFPADNQLYNDNRNKDSRFGKLKKMSKEDFFKTVEKPDKPKRSAD